MAPSQDDEKPIKIDKWDSSALKNTMDDGAKKVLVNILGFAESHRLMDGRLVVCTIAIGFAMFALVWDFMYPFPKSKNVLFFCVLSYFILMGVLTLYLNYIEKGIFLVAVEKDRAMMEPDKQYILSSSLRKYDDTYHLTMSYKDGKSNKEQSTAISKCVANYFDENGMFCFDLFRPVIEKMKEDLTTKKRQ